MIPVVRGFDELLINGKPCPNIQQCSFDLDTKTFNLALTEPTSLLSIGVTGDRPDIMVVVTGVCLDAVSKLRFKLDNEYQYLNTAVVKGHEFSFDIEMFIGAEPCST